MQDSFQLDALSTERELRRRLVELAESTCALRDPALMAACRRLWEGTEDEGGLVGRIWIEGIFPSKVSDRSLNNLVEEGIFSNELLTQLEQQGAFPPERRLYAHQADSIRAAVAKCPNRPGIVVTAGTGAGKTEAFLLPLLNDLYRNPRSPNETGARAIILYPTNALVNDQVDRLYRWLKGQDSITLFHFTGETPEDKRSADEKGYPKFERCRLRTREDARNNPPDILRAYP